MKCSGGAAIRQNVEAITGRRSKVIDQADLQRSVDRQISGGVDLIVTIIGTSDGFTGHQPANFDHGHGRIGNDNIAVMIRDICEQYSLL